MLCIREDSESILDKQIKKDIYDTCKNKFNKVVVTDTVIEGEVYESDRDKVLECKWNEFRKAELVITDRLHGMVFAAITRTPCIVMSNYNHKIRGTYDWIKHLEYIKFVDAPEEAIDLIKEFKAGTSSEKSYEIEEILAKYAPLEECISKALGSNAKSLTGIAL